LWGYRTQIDFLPTTEGTLGFWSGDLGQTIPISECHILREDLWALVSELNLEVENLTNMRVQVGDPGSAMVILRTADESIPELESTLPISINFLLNDNVPINLVGQTHIHQTLAGRPFRVTAGTQFRHYPAQIERLIEVVLGDLDLQGFETALDVYGGVGIFSAFMAAHTSYITYIDSYPPAATDAEENLAEFDHIDILEGSAEDVLATLADEGEGVDVAVLDPPRTGLSDEVMEALDWLGIPRLVYVSQDATSLAQNAKTLVEKYEYRLIKLQPIDFDPQSYRVHSVCLFEKSM
jgi:23S rRNA (uracil1939-C5)-methyltransferase